MPSTPGGVETELDVLEPEPVVETADASDSLEEAAESASAAEGGGEESGGGEQGGGEAGGGEEGGGEEGGGEPGGGEPGGGEEGGGEEGGGEAGGGAQGVSSQQGGGGSGGSLDDELMKSVEVFEDGMQQQILIIASATPSDQMESGGTGDGEMSGSDGELTDQTGGGQGLVIVEGDLSQLPQSAGAQGSADGSSGVITGNGGDGSDRQQREGDSKVSRILIANIPEDIGDGSDDDVVARQIREAAMNEEDPALREKLWAEYRNYKKSLKKKF